MFFNEEQSEHVDVNTNDTKNPSSGAPLNQWSCGPLRNGRTFDWTGPTLWGTAEELCYSLVGFIKG